MIVALREKYRIAYIEPGMKSTVELYLEWFSDCDTITIGACAAPDAICSYTLRCDRFALSSAERLERALFLRSNAKATPVFG